MFQCNIYQKKGVLKRHTLNHYNALFTTHAAPNCA